MKHVLKDMSFLWSEYLEYHSLYPLRMSISGLERNEIISPMPLYPSFDIFSDTEMQGLQDYKI